MRGQKSGRKSLSWLVPEMLCFLFYFVSCVLLYNNSNNNNNHHLHNIDSLKFNFSQDSGLHRLVENSIGPSP